MKKIIFNLMFVVLVTGFAFGQHHDFLQKGIAFQKANQADSAIFYLNKHLKIHKNSTDTIRAIGYLYLAKSYKIKEKFPEALQYFNFAEAIFKKSKNYNRLAETYIGLVEFNRSKYDYTSAKKYLTLTQNLILFKNISKRNIANYWNRKAAVVIELEKNCEKSIEYSKKVLAIARELKDQDLEASSLNEIGYAYENSKRFFAEDYYLEALSIYEKTNNQLYQLDVIINLSRLYELQSRFDESKKMIDKGFIIAKNNNFESIFKTLYEQYYKIYLKTKDFEKAVFYLNLYHEADQKDLKNKWNAQIVDAEKKYEFEKNQKELSLKEIEINKKYAQNLVLTSLLIIAILLIILVYYYFVKTKQKNKLLKILSDENTFLIAEANHRINNNLQLIIILISEELKKADAQNDAQIRKILSKVDAIATLHKHLYKSNNKQNIDIQKYLKDIQINFFEIFKEKSVQVNFNVDNFALKVDVAMYLGLLVTELCINSLKHAFENQEEKIINFSLENNNKLIKFKYSDNGCGFKKEPNLKLINKLCRQLKIDYTIQSKKGFQFSFEAMFKQAIKNGKKIKNISSRR